MALLVTGADVLDRLRRDLKTPSNVGYYSNQTLASYWNEEWADDWTELGAGDYGIGKTRAQITGTGELHPLPADSLYALALARSRNGTTRWPGTYTSDKQINDRGLHQLTGFGGSLEWYYQILTDGTGDTIEVLPALDSSDVIYLTYVTQPPSLGDPTDQGAWQAATINVIAEPIYAHTIARTRVRAVSREDQGEYQRALDDLADRRTKFLEQRRARNLASGVSADRAVSTTGRWIGYGR